MEYSYKSYSNPTPKLQQLSKIHAQGEITPSCKLLMYAESDAGKYRGHNGFKGGPLSLKRSIYALKHLLRKVRFSDEINLHDSEAST